MAETTTSSSTKSVEDLFGSEFATPAETPVVEAADGTDGTDPGTSGSDSEGSKGNAGSFRREIDLGDGSGKQVFEAETADALIDKLTKAQEHATRKIRQQDFELKRAQRAKPERVEATKPKEMTADEQFALAQEFQKDPISALKKIGVDPAELAQYRQEKAQAAAEAAFLTKHGDDFKPSPKNAAAIQKFLSDEQLPYTAANLEYAFQELSEGGLLDKLISDVQDDSNDEAESKEERIVVPEHTRRKPMSSGLRNSNGSSRPEVTEEKQVVAGISESEVAELYKLPEEEARPKMLALMARLEKSAGKRSK